MLKYEFAKYTDVTRIAEKVRPDNGKDHYVKFFICNDVRTFWLARVQKNTNAEYGHEEGVFILEREQIDKTHKKEVLNDERAAQILRDDMYESWDVTQYDNMDDIIEDLDGGFGIN